MAKVAPGQGANIHGVLTLYVYAGGDVCWPRVRLGVGGGGKIIII